MHIRYTLFDLSTNLLTEIIFWFKGELLKLEDNIAEESADIKDTMNGKGTDSGR